MESFYEAQATLKGISYTSLILGLGTYFLIFDI